MSHSTHSGLSGPGSLRPSGQTPSFAMRGRCIVVTIPFGNLSLGFPVPSHATSGEFSGSQSHSLC